MTISCRRARLISPFVVAVALVAAPAFAEVQNYKADLKGSSEVPPNDTKGTGSLTATYDTVTKKLTYSVTYSGLTGPSTAAHFHGPAAPTANAGIALGTTGPLA